MTLCSKQLLNGPCGGAEKGMCEVDKERPCGWVMIYERLKKLGRLELLDPYPKAEKPCPLEPSPDPEGQRNRSHVLLPGRQGHGQQPGLITIGKKE